MADDAHSEPLSSLFKGIHAVECCRDWPVERLSLSLYYNEYLESPEREMAWSRVLMHRLQATGGSCGT
jgi:hypothetical protein